MTVFKPNRKETADILAMKIDGEESVKDAGRILIDRLNIPISADENQLLSKARKIRNELIHGLNMASISTLQIKKLCGVTSRILMYKLMNELREE